LLQKHQLHVKESKCKWAMDQVDFLGHVVGSDGITMDPKKVEAIRNWPEPAGSPEACKSQIRSFVGLANYYRRLIRHFAHLAAPLNELLKEKAEWKWGSAERDAFTELKAALTSAPVFVHAPDPNLPFFLQTDASDFATGAVIFQKPPGDANTHVVAYASHKLKDAERRYPAHEKEMLAVITALEEWRHYLLGPHFTLYTDNSAVSHFLSQPKLSPRQARWVQKFAEYNFDVHHVPGPTNVVADALSRRHDLHKLGAHGPTPARSSSAEIRHACRVYLKTVHALLHLHAINPSAIPMRYRPTDIDAADITGDTLRVPISSLSVSELGRPQEWLDGYKEAANRDEYYEQKRSELAKGKAPAFTAIDGYLYYTPSADLAPRLYVPPGRSRTQLLFEAHDANTSGHRGRDKMVEILQRNYFWPNLSRTVQEYCNTCPTCKCTKPDNQAPSGLLQPLPIPDQVFEVVSHDLITGLPKTDRGFNTIVTFVCKLSKRLIIVPTTDTIDAEGYARLYFDNVFRHFGMPTTLVSDRDPRFTSQFWKALCKRTGTKLAMSTSHHAQTDGQTERANRVIEEMLRAYVSDHQNEWDQHLTAVEFAYNNSKQASSRFTPFYLNYGRHPHTPLSLVSPLPTGGKSPVADAFVGTLQRDLELAKEHLRIAQARHKEYADRSRRPVFARRPRTPLYGAPEGGAEWGQYP